jgi:hypothetical protein
MRDGSSIATLRATRRVWAVGAIHGEATRLELHDPDLAAPAAGDRTSISATISAAGRRRSTAVRFRREVIARNFFAADVVHRGAQEEMWQKLLQISSH